MLFKVNLLIMLSYVHKCSAFTFYCLEQGWLAQCQLKVTGKGIIIICGVVLRCPRTSS